MTGFGSSCGACKFLRRKCSNDCIFAPYFCYDEAANHFAAVHKVFGASNVSKILLHLPLQNRSDAASTISFEALARMRDPIYGCVAHIFALQQQVAYLQEEIEILGNQIASNFTLFGVEICESSEATTNNNSNSNVIIGSHEFLPQNAVAAINSPLLHRGSSNYPEEIMVSQPLNNSNGTTMGTDVINNNSQGLLFDGNNNNNNNVGSVQLSTMYGLGEENNVISFSSSEPIELEGLFDGIIDQYWLDHDNPIIGPIWD